MSRLSLFVLWSALVSAPASASIAGISFVNFGQGGDNDIALTNVTLAPGGKEYTLSFAQPQIPTNDHYGYSCIFAWRDSPPAYFVISGETPVFVLTIHGLTGKLTASKQLNVSGIVIIDMSWMPAYNALIALASPDGYALDIVSIDPTTGGVPVLHAGLQKGSLPRFCESGLSPSASGDPRLYFAYDTNTTGKAHIVSCLG